jgi:hypothetical protein
MMHRAFHVLFAGRHALHLQQQIALFRINKKHFLFTRMLAHAGLSQVKGALL